MAQIWIDPKRWLAAALVAGLAVIPFLNGLQAEFTFDDLGVIRDNPMIQSEPVTNLLFQPYLTYAYRPLTLLTYVANDRISEAPAAYRGVNIALHMLVSLAVLAIGWNVLRSTRIAIAAATIFAVHPIHTEAVTSIVGRAELLAALFVLGASLAFVRSLRVVAAADTGIETGPSRPVAIASSSSSWQVVAAACFAAALLSKESAISALALFPMLHWWTLGRLDWRRALLATTPHLMLAIAYLGLRLAVVGAVGMPGPPPRLDNPLAHVAAGPRVATALVVLWEYVSQLSFPYYLSADYSFNEIPVVLDAFDPRLLLAAAGLAGCVLFVGLAARRAPEVALTAALFLVPLSLTANIAFPIGTIKAERLLYLPSVGWCLLLGWVVCALLRNHRQTHVLLLVVVVSACAVRTAARNRDWHDNTTLFESAVVASPDSTKAHYNLGIAYFRGGRLDDAAVHFRRALEIDPGSAKAAHGIAEIYDQRHIDAGVVAWSERALRLDWSNPKFHLKLGILRYRLGERDAARAAFVEGLALEPEHVSLNVHLAVVELADGDVWSAWDRTGRAIPAAADDPELLALAQATEDMIAEVANP